MDGVLVLLTTAEICTHAGSQTHEGVGQTYVCNCMCDDVMCVCVGMHVCRLYRHVCIHSMHVSSSKDTAVSVVRNAKAVEQEAPLLLKGMRQLSAVNLSRAESKLHQIIRSWGMALPLDIYYFSRCLLFAPMIKSSMWLEYLIVKKSKILLGGFGNDDPRAGGLLAAWWESYRQEHPSHVIFESGRPLSKCIPICLYADEGRGLRKAPVQVVGLETIFGMQTAAEYDKLSLHEKQGGHAAFWKAARHTGSGSSLLSRLLLYVLPHNCYKKAKREFWYRAMECATNDLKNVCESGITCDGATWWPVFVGVKGDAPALTKIGRLTRSFQHWQGSTGTCPYCLAGRAGIPWEDMGAEGCVARNTLAGATMDTSASIVRSSCSLLQRLS